MFTTVASSDIVVSQSDTGNGGNFQAVVALRYESFHRDVERIGNTVGVDTAALGDLW